MAGDTNESDGQDARDTGANVTSAEPDTRRRGLDPVFFGFSYSRTRPGSSNSRLHRAAGEADEFGVLLGCTSGYALRIVRAEAKLTPRGAARTYSMYDVFRVLAPLDIPADRLCQRCFGDAVIAEYRSAREGGRLAELALATAWDDQLAQIRRTFTVSADAAAFIAYSVATTADQTNAEPHRTAEKQTAPHTVTLSGHAAAVIAGLVGPQDDGSSTVADDPNKVWYDGINASDATWDEVRSAFPLSLFTTHDWSGSDFAAAQAEARKVFPLTTFRSWADASMRFEMGLVDHFYDPEAGC